MRKKNVLLLLIVALGLFALPACNNTSTPQKPDTPDDGGTTVQNDGTKAKPYSVAEVIEFNPQSTTEAVKNEVWVKGFVVGYFNTKLKPSAVEVKDFTENYNIMLAAKADETDQAKMVSVQLPAGKLRTDLGLKNVPANFGKEVMVRGDLMKYNNFPGVKNTTSYWFVATDTGYEPEPPAPNSDSVDLTKDTTTPVTSLNENFDNVTNKADIDIAGWKLFKIKGDRNWQGKVYKEEKYAQASAFKGKSENYEYWLVTPPIDVEKLTNKVLSFKTAKAYWEDDSKSTFKVFYLTNKDGKTVQTELTGATLASKDDKDHTFIASGDISLSKQTGIVYIGFQYVNADNAPNPITFRVDDVVVK